jgi:16S rRNA (cytidine1402-2'-O)-methyltransferase
VPALYVVATPIGNLEDISLRAVKILGGVKLIAAEDTRSARKLLSAHHVSTPVTSFHEFTGKEKTSRLISAMADADIALISEAGMPGISDPGYDLINAAIGAGIKVIPVPGPSAVVSALAVSGLPADQFLFLGFLPRRSGDRKRLLKAVSDEERTLAAYEAPHRLKEALVDILGLLGDRRIAVCREMTKLHEEIFRGTVSEAIKYFTVPRGEITLVVAGRQKDVDPEITGEIRAELRRLRSDGLSAGEAAKQVSRKTGLPRRRLYEAVHNLK